MRIALAVVVLLASACSAGGEELLDGFIDEILDDAPLTESDDPAVAAAGYTAEDQSNEQRAEAEIDRALEQGATTNERIRHAENAILARPGDPLYYLYLAWFMAPNGQLMWGEIQNNVGLARGLVEHQFADIQDPERRRMHADRRMLELMMEVTRAALESETDQATRDRHTEKYCAHRYNYLARGFVENTVEGQAYWDWSIGHHLCSSS